MIEMNGEKTYTVNDAAAILDVLPHVIRKAINTGRLKADKIAGAWYIKQDNLAEYVKGSADNEQ